MRAIPAQRLLASHAGVSQRLFLETVEPGVDIEMPAIVAFSPVVLLPAVIATARVLAFHMFESDAMLALDPPRVGTGYLGVSSNVGPIDSTPEGVMRAVLMVRASDVLFRMYARDDKASQIHTSDLLTFYMSDKGQRILMGQSVQDVDASLLTEAPSV